MRIVIPTNGKSGLSDTVAEHFGRCNTYTFIDENGNLLDIIDNTSEHMGGTGLPPELMRQHGADILLCKGLGSRALQLCNQLGIEVYVCQGDTVKEIFEMWRSKRLKRASYEDACRGHH